MEYKKEFDKWNKVKKNLDSSEQGIVFYERQIWWGSVGINVGTENDGKGEKFIRPIYILKKINSKSFVGIPLSSILREDDAHVSFYFNYDFSTAVISQIKVFDKKRLNIYIGTVSDYLHMK